MASTFDNDLRLEEMATGENAGSWGTKTNTNLELIADAFGYGTFTIANADTTLTIPDGSGSDNALRSLYLKISSSADLTTTRVLTIDPNTVSKLWYIENNTSGGQTITISQGSGANVNILNGQAKLVATDGAGAGAAVIDVTQDLAIPDLFIDDDLSLQSDGAIINFGEDADVTLTHVADTGLRLNDAMALEFRDGDLSINSSADGQLDIDADTEVQITAPTVDIDASTEVNISGDLTVDTDTLYVDSTNNRVGMGTTSPDGIFHAKDSSSSLMFKDVSGNAELFIDGSNGDFAGGDYFNIVADSSPNLMFKQANTERFRIDANGRILIATNTARSIVGNSGLALLQIESSDGGKPASQITMNNNSAAGPVAFFAKTRGTTNGSNTIVQGNDYYGSIQFAGADGTDTNTQAAMIAAQVDGTPGSNDMPGRLTFWTTADGASSGTERLRIDTSGLATFYYSTKNTRSVYGGYTAQTLENSNTNAGILTFTQQTWNSANGVGYIRMENSSATNVDSSEFTFHTGDGGSASERMRLDSSGRLLIGVEPARGTVFGASTYYPQFQLEGTGSEESSGLIVRNQDGTGGPYLVLGKTRATATRGVTVVSDGDTVGRLSFQGADGTNLEEAAYVQAQIDGTPGSNDMPGRLGLFTTADGSASPTERLRISSDGHMGFGTSTTTDVFYTFTKGGTDYTGDFATYNMGQMDSFRFYQSATTKWAKVFARSYQTGSQFGTQAAILEVQGHGSTGGNGHHVTIHVTTKQQQSSDGWDIYATGNGGYNVAYKFDATGGHDSAGLLEIWVQPQENYVTTCLWVKTSQRRGDPTSGPVGWFGLEDTGSSTQPSGSTTVQQHNPFMGLHYTDGHTSGKYETSEAYQAWYPRLNINRYLDLGGQGTTKPTIGGSDNQIATISGTSNRASLNFFQTQSGSDGPKIRFAKGRSNTLNGIGTAASDGDQTGIIINYADDGTDVGSYSSYINFKIDGAVSSNDTPGKIVFATTADGAQASTDRIEIPQAGGILMKNSNTPTGGSGTTLHFNTGTRTVSSGTNAVVTLFNRSPDANVSSTGTCYVAAENSGGSVQFGYIIDFFYSNGTLQTTARETGSSQGTVTATIAESGTNLSITVTYAGGLGGAIRFNAGGTAINCSY